MRLAAGSAPRTEPPQVTVLMATFNGRRWMDEQIDSILDQEDVRVTLVVSDDGSDDGTLQHLTERAGTDPRIRVLARREGPAGVAANFLHLFMGAAVPGQQFVALSDQDDVWHSDKLKRQIALLSGTGADAVSSNVTSFDGRGRRRLVVKSLPQRRWDYIFEAAGPGSTYVFTGDMHERLVRVLAGLDTSVFGVHDWLLYALVRAVGGTWVIDDRPTVDYRQHGDNVQGEHAGFEAFRSRLSKLRSGFYRKQFLLIASAVRQVGAPVNGEGWTRDLDGLIGQLEDTGLRGRLSFWRRRGEIRRDRREGFELALAHLLWIW
ncbi:glycosyltransferase [Actinomyces sp.]|uniref:glycosyltransferase n=1 Tax=Actinomyces sp. TaxID=29317 RepID=UPI0028995BCE|nr:glycosyltransferase [Actinomyces sp.]